MNRGVAEAPYEMSDEKRADTYEFLRITLKQDFKNLKERTQEFCSGMYEDDRGKWIRVFKYLEALIANMSYKLAELDKVNPYSTMLFPNKRYRITEAENMLETYVHKYFRERSNTKPGQWAYHQTVRKYLKEIGEWKVTK